MARDDETLRMNHKNDNDVTPLQPSLRNVELLTEMFGTNAPTLKPTADTKIEWK